MFLTDWDLQHRIGRHPNPCRPYEAWQRNLHALLLHPPVRHISRKSAKMRDAPWACICIHTIQSAQTLTHIYMIQSFKAQERKNGRRITHLFLQHDLHKVSELAIIIFLGNLMQIVQVLHGQMQIYQKEGQGPYFLTSCRMQTYTAPFQTHTYQHKLDLVMSFMAMQHNSMDECLISLWVRHRLAGAYKHSKSMLQMNLARLSGSQFY